MSAPKQLLKNADEIRVGFLSARTSAVLANVLAQNNLAETDKPTLQEAEAFLTEIAEGANIATTSTFRQGVSPSRSIAAFDLALGPIQALKMLVGRDSKLDSFFESLSQAIHRLRETGDSTLDAKELEHAKGFFDALRSWVTSEVNTKRTPTGLRLSRVH